jgi:hypothetical protein
LLNEGHRLITQATGRWLRGPVGVTLAIIALGAVAVRPILLPVWPCTDDIAFHLLRLTQLDHLLRQGVLYSRWAPDMAQGYGYPLFNFYAPLSYYVAAAVSGWGLGLSWGLRATFALAIAGSGLAAYRLARDYFSRPAALATAVAYMYAPYQGYDIYFRGNLAESAAWPLLALSLWTMGRLARHGGGWPAAAGLSYAAVLLTHNVFALIFSPLLAAYGLIMATTARQERNGRPLLQVSAALAIGLGLSAFFWLPAMAERALVHSDRLLFPPAFVYWANFISWRELLAWPATLRPDLLNPSPARALGAVPVLSALPALAWLRPGRQWKQRGQVAFFGVALLVYAVLMTAVSQPIWDRLPVMAYIQFPWRLLGPATLCLALLIGAAVDSLPRKWSGLLALVMIAGLILSSLFWFDPRTCAGIERPTTADIQLFEQQTNTIGTTATGEYLPRTVQHFPSQAAGTTFTAAGLPDGARLLRQETKGLRHTAELQTAGPGIVTVNIFSYPGWQVRVNGRPVPITPSPDYGLISFPVADGRQEIMIRFGETPLRLAANIMALVSLVLVGGATAVRWRRRTEQTRPAAQGQEDNFPVTAVALGLILLLTATWLLPRGANPFYQPGLPDGGPVTVDYQGGMRLHGVAGWPDPLPADQPLRFDLRWTVTERSPVNYQTRLVLLGPDGYRWSSGDTAAPRDFRPAPPTASWLPGQYAQESHLLTPLPGTPPGVYTVQLVLFDRASLQPVATVDGALEVELGVVVLARPLTGAPLPAQYGATASWGDLALTGYNLDRLEAAPGDPFLLTTFWQTLAAPPQNRLAQLSLLDPAGKPAWQQHFPLTRADFPLGRWQAGDQWRGQHLLRLPATLAGGVHRWQLQLCRPHADGRSCQAEGMTADLGLIQINAPIRSWTAPEMTAVLKAPAGDLATLAGATWSPDGRQPGKLWPVELIWRAERETGVSYAVFLHLIGPDGQLVAQHDGEPANWTRPTTGWLPGEFIRDERALHLPAELPAGTYRLVAGFYEPQTGQRLVGEDGATAVTIATFVHE